MNVADAIARSWERQWFRQKDGKRSYVRANLAFQGMLGALSILPQESPDCSTITSKMLVEQSLAWSERGLSGASINRRLAAASTVLRQSSIESGHPMPIIQYMAECRPREDTLTKEEARTFAAAFKNEAHQRLFHFLLHTGCRLSEAFALQAEDIFLSGMQATVTFRDTKNGSTRILPLSNARSFLLVPPREEVEDHELRKSGGVFENVGRRGFQREFYAIQRKLLPGRQIVVHSLRHTAATWMVTAGVTLEIVAKILGHSSTRVTQRYAHYNTETLVSGVNCLSF